MHTTAEDFKLIDQALASLSAQREVHVRLQQAMQRIDADLHALAARELGTAEVSAIKAAGAAAKPAD